MAERLLARPAFREPSVLGRAIHGVVSWNINDSCNYRCSYCTQRFMPERSYRLEEVDAYVRAFGALPGRWEVKLSGGEPFQQPGLAELAAGLVAQGHVISIQTNFSAAPARLEDFLAATRGAVNVFSASLHLEYARPRDFVEKYRVVAPYEAYGLRFNVTSVATPARLRELAEQVAPLFRAEGIVFKVQPEKVRGVVRRYTEEEKRMLLVLGGHNLTGEIAPGFQGRWCHAGARYFVIKSNGEAYRCYPASRLGGRYARLGSFVQGIRLPEGPRLCPYPSCHCTVPIHRGMIEGALLAEVPEDAEVGSSASPNPQSEIRNPQSGGKV